MSNFTQKAYDQARQDKLRNLLKQYYKHRDNVVRRFCEAHKLDFEEVAASPWRYIHDGLRLPPFLSVLRGLTCGAKTRKGTPCKNRTLYRSGRCKFHGGMSTGPKTEEGKRRSAMNGRRNKTREDLREPEDIES